MCRELGLVPDLFDVARADADQSALETTPLQLVERVDRTCAWDECIAGEGRAELQALCESVVLQPEAAEVGLDATDLPIVVRGRPDPVEIVDVPRERMLHPVELLAGPQREGVPEVEDHCAQRLTTS